MCKYVLEYCNSAALTTKTLFFPFFFTSFFLLGDSILWTNMSALCPVQEIQADRVHKNHTYLNHAAQQYDESHYLQQYMRSFAGRL